MLLRIVWVLLASLLASACGRPVETLVVTGSSTIAPVFGEIAARFEAVHPVRIDVQSGGSGRGIQDARSGLAQIGLASRALTAAERGEGLVEHLLAWDGIVLIVHRDNPVQLLSRDQVRALFTGAARSWAEAGGGATPVVVVNKAEGRSTLALFLEEFGLDNADVRADIVAGENQQVILSVAGNRGAVGYVSIGAALAAERDGSAIRTLPLDGVSASMEAVAGGRWPLRRPLSLVTAGAPAGQAAALIDYALRDPAAQALLEKHYFVPAAR